MKIVYSCFLLIFFAFSFQASAQREGAIEYEKEFIGGVNFNTNGGLIGGFMFRYAKLLYNSKNQFHNFNFEIGIVKHPKELRYASPTSSGSFIAYKENYLTVLRPSYGREFVLFHKGNEDGVQLDFLIQGGFSLGILTPYYVNYITGPNTSEYIAYDPDKLIYGKPFSLGNVINSGNFTTGLGESKLVPGLHVRTGFSFEYSHFDSNVTGIEVGFLFEAFTQKMVMLSAPQNVGYGDSDYKNKQFFSSVYLNIYYGGRK